MAPNQPDIDQTGDKEYETTDQGFGAYLATKFMFLGAVDTGQPMRKDSSNTKKSFLFLVPEDEDMEQQLYKYRTGAPDTKVPAIVTVNKMRLMRQSCNHPIDVNAVKG